MYDACPWCGFANNDSSKNLAEDSADSLWAVILTQAIVSSREELIQKFNLQSYVTREESDFYPSLFNHSSDPDTSPVYKYIWACQRKHRDSRVEDQLIGRRVCLANNQAQEGTIMKVKDGKLFILWDKHKDSTLPYFDYSLSDIGDLILPITAGQQDVEVKYVVGHDYDGYIDYRVDLGDSKKTYSNDLELATKYDCEESFAGHLGLNERLITIVHQHGQWCCQV